MKSKSNIIYKDIIDLPYNKSTRRKWMGSTDRAAQFAPFAALNGHGEAVEETARTTSYKIELDEYRLKELNDELKPIWNYYLSLDGMIPEGGNT